MAVQHTGFYIPKIGPKDPDSTAWFGVIWDDALMEEEVILDSEWIISPDNSDSPLTIEQTRTNEEQTVDGTTYNTVNKVLLSGGKARRTYTVTNRVTTSEEQTLDYSFRLAVWDT